MKRKIFFQGDSITDAGRDKRDNHYLSGFSSKVANILGDEFEYVNYGLSGHTSRHVLLRHEKEFLKEKPDYLVYMIGINDVWRHYDGHDDDAVSEEECISNIIKVISVSRAINPQVKIIFVEPYFIAGPIPALKEATDVFKLFLKEIRNNIPQLVDKYIYTYEEFLELQTQGDTIADDGVHPNGFGQEKIANKIVEAIKSLE